MHHIIKFLLLTSAVTLNITASGQTNYMDQDFGDHGISLAPTLTPSAITMQSDAKILVAGRAAAFSKVYRYNPDGSLDTGFGNQGIASPGILNNLAGIHQLPDEKILLVGSRSLGMVSGSASRIAFTKLNANGSIDSTFGLNGTLSVNEYAQQSNLQKITAPTKVRFLGDGKIVIAGRIGYSYANPLAAGPPSITRVGPLVTRFNADLTLDTTFAGTGYSKLPNTVSNQFYAMEVLPDGSILAGLQSGGDIRLYKYLPDGQPDPVFGTGGVQIIDIGASDDKISDIKVFADGKILISGSKALSSRDAFIAKLTENGALDPDYGTGGILAFTNVSGQAEYAVETVLLDNGQAVTGLQKWNGNYDLEPVFTTTAGTIDELTGNSGKISIPLEDNERLSCMLQQPDGKIILAGYNENNCILARFGVVSVLLTETSDKPEIRIFPNPAGDLIHVSGLPDHTLLELYDMSGQLILETVTEGNTQMDLSRCAPGMYLIRSGHHAVKVIRE